MSHETESPPPRELRELDREECLRRLASESFGRVVTNMPGGAPVIRPVNYVFDPDSQGVLFRTDAGSKLHALLASKQATFEIDGVDPEGRTGWSVIVTGVAEEITHPGELHRVAGIGVDPYVPDGKTRWLRVRAFTVTGRHVTLGERS